MMANSRGVLLPAVLRDVTGFRWSELGILHPHGQGASKSPAPREDGSGGKGIRKAALLFRDVWWPQEPDDNLTTKQPGIEPYGLDWTL